MDLRQDFGANNTQWKDGLNRLSASVRIWTWNHLNVKPFHVNCGLNRLSASVRIWTICFVAAEDPSAVRLNRLSASVRIWTAIARIEKFAVELAVLIAFRLQSEFGL